MLRFRSARDAEREAAGGDLLRDFKMENEISVMNTESLLALRAMQ